MAAGAEVSLGGILLLNGVDDLANNSPRCSALAVGEDRTAQGAYLMGRNLDYPVFTEYLCRIPDPVSHLPAPGSAPGLSGLAGICGGVHRHQRLRGGPGPALRHEPGPHPQGDAGGPALSAGPGRRGHGGRGGRRRPQSARAPSATISCSADPGEALVLELSARHGAVRRPQDGLLTTTNHYQSPAMQGLKGRFPPRPPDSVLSA